MTSTSTSPPTSCGRSSRDGEGWETLARRRGRGRRGDRRHRRGPRPGPDTRGARRRRRGGRAGVVRVVARRPAGDASAVELVVAPSPRARCSTSARRSRPGSTARASAASFTWEVRALAAVGVAPVAALPRRMTAGLATAGRAVRGGGRSNPAADPPAPRPRRPADRDAARRALPAVASGGGQARPDAGRGRARRPDESRPGGAVPSRRPSNSPKRCRGCSTRAPSGTAVSNGWLRLRPIRVEAVGELLGTAECRQVPAVHLVGRDPEALPNDPALEVGGEEAVVAAQQEPRRHVRPGGERPRLLERRAGLSLTWCTDSATTSGGTSWRNSSTGSNSSSGPAVARRLLTARRLPAGVRPPVARPTRPARAPSPPPTPAARPADSFAHQGRGEAGERLGDDDEVLPAVADRVARPRRRTRPGRQRRRRTGRSGATTSWPCRAARARPGASTRSRSRRRGSRRTWPRQNQTSRRRRSHRWLWRRGSDTARRSTTTTRSVFSGAAQGPSPPASARDADGSVMARLPPTSMPERLDQPFQELAGSRAPPAAVGPSPTYSSAARRCRPGPRPGE